MNSKTITLFVGALVLIIIGMFTFAYVKRADIEKEDMSEQVPVDQTAYDGIERIDAKHFYINGVHTLAGEILMPTPCDLLEHDFVIMESYPEQVVVDFTVINNADICAQVVTPQRFLVSFSASEEADIRATLQQRSVILNLVPAAAGETPDDFELYIKG
ncbi:hypothetical protein KTR10_02465 [Candidatus Kaiserbacteria bacterium]|nr:hypothetical protein [Candidatus Kaiserbacteria bacterium]